MHEAQVVGQHGGGVFVGGVDEGSGHQTFLNHGVHSSHSLVGSSVHTSIVQLAVSADIQVILTGFQTTDAEQSAGEAEHIDTALVVVILTGEQTKDGVGAVQSLSICHDTTQQSHQFVSIPSSVLTNEQVSTVGAVVAVVSLVDVLTKHIYSLNAVKGSCCVHKSNNVACLIIILSDLLNAGSISLNNVDLYLAAGGHVGSVNCCCKLLRSLCSEFTLTVKELLNPVGSHKGHTLNVVYTVEVGGEVDSTVGGVTCDGKTNDGVSFKISLEVRHVVKVFSNVNNLACYACLGKLGSGTAYHINVTELFLPVLEFLGSGFALVMILKLNAENVLNLNPSGLKVARVVGIAICKGNTLACNLCVKEQTGLLDVITGCHTEHSAFGIRKCEFKFVTGA